MNLIILLLISYLAGSVNFAIILFKLLGKQDPRQSFSGNAGTTNVYRQAGPVWAALVLILDAGRAVGIALLALYILPLWQVPWPGLALVIGNRYPCFHRFKGGKGVANYLGFSAAVTPHAAAASAAAWVIVYFMKRITFVASFAMVLTLAVGTIIATGYDPLAATGTVLTLLFIIYNHKTNIIKLRQARKAGKEGLQPQTNGDEGE
jgi:acyl phosphate:glycerol-3-phosphate acyltransferase